MFVLYCRGFSSNIDCNHMSRPWRFILVFLGLSIICCALMVLAYVFWPVAVQNIQATLEPSLFISP